VEVDGGTDYRRLKMEKLRVYHSGADAEAQIAGISRN
jgi:predicted ATPase